MASPTSNLMCVHKQQTEHNKHLNSKRLVICCDGTWNDSNALGKNPQTNVSKLSSAVAQKCCTGKPQIVYYHPGAGTETSKVARLIGGIFGIGVEQDIVETYRFICDNYNPGDEVILVGFSRGAFTARSVADMICNLGYLSRAGLEKLPYIFRDYETWQDWRDEDSFDPKKHLQAFTVDNKDEIRRYEAKRDPIDSPLPTESDEEDRHETLEKRKKELWERIRSHHKVISETYKDKRGKSQTKRLQYADRRAMADEYRKMLAENWMLQGEKHPDPSDGKKMNFHPVDGKVKAVAVWDTVGSLGMPKMPWIGYHSSRSDDEVRFTSIEADPNVENAFHALALDELRTSYGATMWETRRPIKGLQAAPADQYATRMRQVWFPGDHGNCGGGRSDSQISTISLAWMADQLTSVGVEFDKNEMERIFFSLEPGARVNEWGMGDIHRSTGSTSVPDRVWNFLAAPYRSLTGRTGPTGRYPGLYGTESVVRDGEDDRLHRAGEMVHPTVRLRYAYDGRGPNGGADDRWECPALVANGYRLKRRAVQGVTIRNPYVNEVDAPYSTVTGTAKPIFVGLGGSSGSGGSAGRQQTAGEPKVKDADPLRAVVTEQPRERELWKLDDARNHWVWERTDEDLPEGDAKKVVVLPEEQIGVWERMFIMINAKKLAWQQFEDEDELQRGTQKKKSASVWSKIKGGLGKMQGALKNLFKKSPSKFIPDGIPELYGYHDILVWQHGDKTE